jgi:hypothetical protein
VEKRDIYHSPIYLRVTCIVGSSSLSYISPLVPNLKHKKQEDINQFKCHTSQINFLYILIMGLPYMPSEVWEIAY